MLVTGPAMATPLLLALNSEGESMENGPIGMSVAGG